VPRNAGKDELVVALERAIDDLLAGRRYEAGRILGGIAPTVPLLLRPSGAQRQSLLLGETLRSGTRQALSKRQYLSTFSRDRFICRYCGRYTIFLQV
jgi:hypothetical protein